MAVRSTRGRLVLIGAGAVVTKDVPANAIAVGVPARVTETVQTDTDLVAREIARLTERQHAGRNGHATPARK